MSNCDRSGRTSFIEWIIPAVYIAGFLIIAGMTFLNVAGHKPSPEQQYYSSECGKADERYRILVDDTLPRALHAEESTKAGKREKKAREQVAHWCDLLAQQASAEATVFAAKQSLWTNIFAAGVFFLTFAGVWLLLGTLTHTKAAAIAAKSAADSGERMVGEAKRTTRVTREIGHAQAQPYLSIEDVKTSDFRIANLPFDPDGGIRSLTLSFSISNKGNSPAIDVAIDARVALAFQTQGTSGQKTSTTKALNPVVLNYVTKGTEQGKTLLFNGCFKDRQFTKINPKNTIITIDFDVSYKDIFSDKITRVTETHMALNISANTELWRISSKFEQFIRTDPA